MGCKGKFENLVLEDDPLIVKWDGSESIYICIKKLLLTIAEVSKTGEFLVIIRLDSDERTTLDWSKHIFISKNDFYTD